MITFVAMWWKVLAPFRALYKIWFILIFLITGLPQWPLYYILLKLKLFNTAFFIQKWIWLPLLMLGNFIFPVVIKPKGYRLPKGPYVICANHTSYLDIILMYWIIPKPMVFLGKEELKKFPIIGMFFKMGPHVPVNRSDKSEASASLKIIHDKVRQGAIVVIFPEGTQSKKAPSMNPFKAGAFKVAIGEQVPVVAMTWLDNWQILSNPAKLTGWARPGISRVIFHPVVNTNGKTMEDLIDLQEETFRVIKTPLEERYPGYFKDNA